MLYGEFVTSKNNEKALDIRKEVFIEEQNIDPDIERDSNDEYSEHFILYEDDEAIGTGRLLFKNGLYKIGRIAVLKHKRQLGYGDFIVRSLLEKAFRIGADIVYVGSQVNVVSFYESIGFKEISEPYLEANIPHVMMAISPFEVKSHCKGH